jgi:transcription initiation factor TFIIIB Brf1 subunit/transcription initiation factor TFIIB
MECPRCKSASLFYDSREKSYLCLLCGYCKEEPPPLKKWDFIQRPIEILGIGIKPATREKSKQR